MSARLRRARLDHREPADQLEAFFLDFLASQLADVDRARVLMRELLDNRARAAKARSWFLRPFLDELVEIARALPSGTPIDEERAFALVYSLVGAVHYFTISEPTLSRMYGRRRYGEIRAEMAEELRSLIRSRVEALVD